MPRNEIPQHGGSGESLVPASSFRRSRFRNLRNDVIAGAEGLTATGMVAAEIIVNKGGNLGVNLLNYAALSSGAANLVIDAADRVLYRRRPAEVPIVELQEPGQVEDTSTLPVAELPGRAKALNYISAAVATIGLPILAYKFGNVPVEVLSGAAETLIVANLPRRPGIIRRFYRDEPKFQELEQKSENKRDLER